jgi:hypothetical protein
VLGIRDSLVRDGEKIAALKEGHGFLQCCNTQINKPQRSQSDAQ